MIARSHEFVARKLWLLVAVLALPLRTFAAWSAKERRRGRRIQHATRDVQRYMRLLSSETSR